MDDLKDKTTTQVITDAEKASLLFMLEEDKLARDTYIYINNVWSINQFGNIKDSKQTHMDAIENLLKKYSKSYTVLPFGKFEDKALQD